MIDIAELRRLMDATKDPGLRWEAGNVASRNYFAALKAAAPELLRDAEVAARVGDSPCCLNCIHFGPSCGEIPHKQCLTKWEAMK